VCALLSSRTFSYGEEDFDQGEVSMACTSARGFGGVTATTTGRNCVLPVIDFTNGSHCGLHNCELSEVVIACRSCLVLAATTDIGEGEQLILHYAQCDNSKYLLSYNYVPYKRDVVTSNPDQEVRLDFSSFLCRQLRQLQCPSTGDYYNRYSGWSNEEIWEDVLPVLSTSVPALLVVTRRDVLSDPLRWELILRDHMSACLMFLRRTEPHYQLNVPQTGDRGGCADVEEQQQPTLDEGYEEFSTLFNVSVALCRSGGAG
jgi:hypothetical protein